MGVARVGRGSAFVGGLMLLIALVALGLAACTSGAEDSEGPDDSTTVSSTSTDAQSQTTTTTLSAPAAQSSLLHTVTVSGTGHMSALPDEAVITVGVQENADTAAAALDANSKKMQDVLARLKAEGIPDSAIETANVSVYSYPVYEQNTGRQTGTTYQASNSVTVTLTDFSAIGSVFAAATEAGANNLNGPSWQLSDNTEAQTQALAQASAQAHAKAEAFAAANGVTLGNVLVLTEGYSSPVYYYGSEFSFTTTTAAAALAAPPISPQNLDIYINVTITYQLER